MIGARKPESRSCPVILDPTVAASFVGLLGGALVRGRGPARPLAVRRPARRRGRRRGVRPARRRPRPGRPCHRALRRRGRRRARRTALIEGGALRTYLYDTYTARRGGRRLDRQRRPRRLPQPPSVSPPTSSSPRPRRARASCWPRPPTASRSPTSPACTPASTRSPGSSRSAPRDARSAAASWPSRCASSRSPATSSRCCAPCGRPERRRAGSPSAARVSTPPLLIGEMTISGS